MDPVTTAIVSAVTAGLASGATDTIKQTVVDAYNTVKNLVKSKLGHSNDVSKAIENLEENPTSKGQPIVLSEQIEAANLQQEPDVLKAAQHLLELLKQQPGGEQHIMVAKGKFIAQADHGSSSTITINKG
jgi:hypothetical protein